MYWLKGRLTVEFTLFKIIFFLFYNFYVYMSLCVYIWNPISTWYWMSLVHAIWNFCRIYYYGPKPCVLLFSALESYVQIQSAFRRRLQCLWAINVNSFVLRSVSDHGDHDDHNWHMTLLLAKLSSMLEYGLFHSYVNR